MNTDTDIIVVGGGPAGLSLCRSLAGSGLQITLIEEQSKEQLADPPFDGREIALTHPSKATLENLNIWANIDDENIFKLRQAKVVNGNSPYALHFPVPEQTSKGKAIDALGYFISNQSIRQGAYRACAQQDNINWLTNKRVKTAWSDKEHAVVTLENGENITAKLLIAADSRFSLVRREMGIATDMHDFGRTVLVFRLSHSISNDHTAFECFFYGATLALLPLNDHLTNCVVTIETRKAHTLKQMSDEQLANYITEQVDGRFGEMRLASTVHDYPLVGVHARSFHSTRCALIGDAACGMHPVTAHGFNLGLKSQDILSRLILRQAAQGKDIAAPEMLQSYTRQHMLNTRPLYHGTNFIVKLFTNESKAGKFIRRRFLRLSNNIGPLKKIISQQLTG